MSCSKYLLFTYTIQTIQLLIIMSTAALVIMSLYYTLHSSGDNMTIITSKVSYD